MGHITFVGRARGSEHAVPAYGRAVLPVSRRRSSRRASSATVVASSLVFVGLGIAFIVFQGSSALSGLYANLGAAELAISLEAGVGALIRGNGLIATLALVVVIGLAVRVAMGREKTKPVRSWVRDHTVSLTLGGAVAAALAWYALASATGLIFHFMPAGPTLVAAWIVRSADDQPPSRGRRAALLALGASVGLATALVLAAQGRPLDEPPLTRAGPRRRNGNRGLAPSNAIGYRRGQSHSRLTLVRVG